MKSQKNYNEGARPVYEGEVITSLPARKSINMLLSTRPGSIMLQNAMLEAGHDKCRAMMAQEVIEHVGTLTTIANRMSSLAPQSNEHYRDVIDAYARKAVRQIERM